MPSVSYVRSDEFEALQRRVEALEQFPDIDTETGRRCKIFTPKPRKNWRSSSIDEIRKLLDVLESMDEAKQPAVFQDAEKELRAQRDEQANVIISLLKEKGELIAERDAARDACAELKIQRDDLYEQLPGALEDAKQMADTISELRENLEVSQSVRDGLAQRLATYENAVDADTILQGTRDAKLGALVRQMPKGKSLKRQDFDTEYWICEYIGRGFPEEVLQALKERTDG